MIFKKNNSFIACSAMLIICCLWIYYLCQNQPLSLHKNNLKTASHTNSICIEPLHKHTDKIKELLAMHEHWKSTGIQNIVHNDRSSEYALPTTILAFYNGILAGSCSIEATCPVDTSRTPWVGYLFVKPEFRGKKIARLLIKEILHTADQYGYPKIFFLARNQDHVDMYSHFGGDILQKTRYCGYDCWIMDGSLKQFIHE